MQQRAPFLKRRALTRPAFRLEAHREHRVRPRGFPVHLGHPHPSVEAPFREKIVRLLRVRHHRFGQALYEDPFLVVFANHGGVSFGVGGSRWRQQIRHRLVVDFQVRTLHNELDVARFFVLRCIRVNKRSVGLISHPLEDALQHARDQPLRLRVIDRARAVRTFPARQLTGRTFIRVTRALHGERLPRARLAVRDQTPVVPFQESIRNGNADGFENRTLALVLITHVVVAVRGMGFA